MPRLKRRERLRRDEWTDGHKSFLTFGLDLWQVGWRQYVFMDAIPDAVLDDMRDAWEFFADEILDECQRDPVMWTGRRPWGWWQFDAPEPLDTRKDEVKQLRRLKLLTEAEEAELKLRKRKAVD